VGVSRTAAAWLAGLLAPLARCACRAVLALVYGTVQTEYQRVLFSELCIASTEREREPRLSLIGS
jgi:hypothetical protein